VKLNGAYWRQRMHTGAFALCVLRHKSGEIDPWYRMSVKLTPRFKCCFIFKST
jgi:hypothetical protein